MHVYYAIICIVYYIQCMIMYINKGKDFQTLVVFLLNRMYTCIDKGVHFSIKTS